MRLPRCAHRTPGHRLPPEGRGAALCTGLRARHGGGALAPSSSEAEPGGLGLGPGATSFTFVGIQAPPLPMCHQLQNDCFPNRRRDRTFEFGTVGDGGASRLPNRLRLSWPVGTTQPSKCPVCVQTPVLTGSQPPCRPPSQCWGGSGCAGLPFLHSPGMFTARPPTLGCPQNQSALSSTGSRLNNRGQPGNAVCLPPLFITIKCIPSSSQVLSLKRPPPTPGRLCTPLLQPAVLGPRRSL